MAAFEATNQQKSIRIIAVGHKSKIDSWQHWQIQPCQYDGVMLTTTFTDGFSGLKVCAFS
jgi:hypothetical protein